jgi:hypothetical protein
MNIGRYIYMYVCYFYFKGNKKKLESAIEPISDLSLAQTLYVHGRVAYHGLVRFYVHGKADGLSQYLMSCYVDAPPIVPYRKRPDEHLSAM